MERAAFLERVGRSLRGVEPQALPTTFPPTPASGAAGASRDELADRFLARLAAASGEGSRVSPDALAGAVAEVVRGLGRRRRVVVAGNLGRFEPAVEEGLAGAGAEVLRPEAGSWVEEAAGADLGITSASLAVAATGSILLVPGPDHPRVASLLPTVHLAVVPASRLVPGLEDVMPVLASVADSSSAPVLVTGPSRTTDIEMTMVLGVHGPRALHVLLVEDLD